ncbi:putative reverse transcriptase domain-containing protein [Tanacetum coccineum]
MVTATTLQAGEFAKVYKYRDRQGNDLWGSYGQDAQVLSFHNARAPERPQVQSSRHFAQRLQKSYWYNTNVANTQKGNGTAPKGNGCFECGATGHFKRDC